MSLSTSQPTPDEPSDAGVPAGPAGIRCENCGAAVDPEQRYCVECGIHRIGVPDPAATFMNRPAARPARAARAVVVSARRSRLLSALMIALIPVAIGIGVLIGRSSNNGDAQLTNALRNEHAQVVTVQSGATKVVTVAGSGSGASTQGAKSKTAAASAKATKSQAVGAPQTKAEQKQSAATVKKLNNSTGSSYLDPITSQVGGG